MASKAAILPRGKGRTEIGDLVLDLTVRQRHALSARATDNPVEGGAPTSDHVIQNPDKVSLEGIFSDTPPDADRASVGRSRDKFEELVRIKESGESFDLVTSLRVYPNSVIEAIDTTLEPNTGYIVPVSIRFKQIRQAELQLVTIPPEETDVAGAPGKADRGKQRATEVDEETEKENSILYDALGLGD